MASLPPHLRVLQSPSATSSRSTSLADEDHSSSQSKKSPAIVQLGERSNQLPPVSVKSNSLLSGFRVSAGGIMDESPLEAMTADLEQLPSHLNALEPTSIHAMKMNDRAFSPEPAAPIKSDWLPPHLKLGGDSNASVASSVASSASETPVVERPSTASQKSSIMDQPDLSRPRAYGSSTMSASSARSVVSDRTEPEVLPKSVKAMGKARIMDQPTPAAKPTKLRTGDAAEWTKQTEVPRKTEQSYPCPYETCALGFGTLKILKKHKQDRHDYCIKCNLDFKDFQDHLDHKVTSPNHITCPVCSEDFKSSGGRDAHILAMHPNPQDLHCPGCGEKFIRAGSLIDHIEKNTCRSISIDQFERYRAVHAIREAHLSTLNGREETEDEDVPLMDDTESMTETSIGGVTLEPETDHFGPDDDEREVQYPTLAPNAVPTPQFGPGGPSALPLPTSTATGKGKSYADKAKANLESATPSEAPSTPVTSKKVIQVSMDSPPGERKFPAWTTQAPGTRILFPENKSRELDPNKPQDVQEMMTRMLVGQVKSSPGLKFLNGQSVEAINPQSPEFNPDGFIDPLGRWKCPYPGCGKFYFVRAGFVSHLNSPAHRGVDHRCPECLKMFKSATAITQHMEATGSKCKIRDSKNYGKIIGLVSGGLLAVEGQHVDGTVRYEAAEPEW